MQLACHTAANDVTGNEGGFVTGRVQDRPPGTNTVRIRTADVAKEVSHAGFAEIGNSHRNRLL